MTAGDGYPGDPGDGSNDDATRSDFSRRDALKKLGVAAGIAWTAPVLMTFHNAAGASEGTPDTTTTVTTPPPHEECIGATCATFRPCSSSNTDCVCVTASDGNAYCVPGSTLCDPLADCGAGGTCPDGFFCAQNTCCNRDVCAPFSLAASCPPDPQRRAESAGARVPTGAGTIGG